VDSARQAVVSMKVRDVIKRLEPGTLNNILKQAGLK